MFFFIKPRTKKPEYGRNILGYLNHIDLNRNFHSNLFVLSIWTLCYFASSPIFFYFESISSGIIKKTKFFQSFKIISKWNTLNCLLRFHCTFWAPTLIYKWPFSWFFAWVSAQNLIRKIYMIQLHNFHHDFESWWSSKIFCILLNF